MEQVLLRLEQIELRLDRIEQRLDAVEKRLDAVEKRLDAVEKRLDSLEERVDFLEDQFANMFLKINKMEIQMVTKTEFEEFKVSNAAQHDLTMSGLNRLNDEFVIFKDKILDHEDRIVGLEIRVTPL